MNLQDPRMRATPGPVDDQSDTASERSVTPLSHPPHMPAVPPIPPAATAAAMRQHLPQHYAAMHPLMNHLQYVHSLLMTKKLICLHLPTAKLFGHYYSVYPRGGQDVKKVSQCWNIKSNPSVKYRIFRATFCFPIMQLLFTLPCLPRSLADILSGIGSGRSNSTPTAAVTIRTEDAAVPWSKSRACT